MAKPNIPNVTFMKYSEGYEDISVDPLDYEGKNVLIMGMLQIHQIFNNLLY